jgi:hypothetical protein
VMADQYRDRVHEVLAQWGGPDPTEVLRPNLPPAPSRPQMSRRKRRVLIQDDYEDDY